ncbi:MAG: gliding motility-associated ABC transporter ATP-binding subunit GldA [Verrucomicrobia bacterium]|nr:gliding motility-associated ABC transporter ATP-binding subunit GldA [Verrucomicrobiota bacterium]
MSIVVENVSKHYGKQKALNEISFEVKPGEIVGFLGPNGAGKSTMMKIITAYIPATSGKVQVCGMDVSKEPMKIKRLMGYLPEQNPLYHEMYVKEFLLFIAGLHKLNNKKKRVSKIIKKVGLELEQHKKIQMLSKGYKQRVGLAQALLHDPDVLILDEPTSGLDPNQLKEIRALIKQIGAEKTVMLSTHIMQEVEAICDRVIIINRGNMVANDTVENLGSVLQSKDQIRVEFEQAMEKKDLESIHGVIGVKKVSPTVWTLQHDPKVEIRNQLFQLAVDNKTTVLTLQKETTKLEDIFKALTSSPVEEN